MRRTELEEEMVDDVYRIIRQEFADDEDLDDSTLDAAKSRVAAGKTTDAPEAKTAAADEEAAVTHASATETAPEHTPLVTDVATENEPTTEDAGASSPAEPAQ